MKKLPWIRIVILIALWVSLTVYHNYFMFADTNAIAVSQLEDSNESYSNFQMWKTVQSYYWLAYLLPLLMFVNLLFKKQKQN